MRCGHHHLLGLWPPAEPVPSGPLPGTLADPSLVLVCAVCREDSKRQTALRGAGEPGNSLSRAPMGGRGDGKGQGPYLEERVLEAVLLAPSAALGFEVVRPPAAEARKVSVVPELPLPSAQRSTRKESAPVGHLSEGPDSPAKVLNLQVLDV